MSAIPAVKKTKKSKAVKEETETTQNPIPAPTPATKKVEKKWCDLEHEEQMQIRRMFWALKDEAGERTDPEYETRNRETGDIVKRQFDPLSNLAENYDILDFAGDGSIKLAMTVPKTVVHPSWFLVDKLVNNLEHTAPDQKRDQILVIGDQVDHIQRAADFLSSPEDRKFSFKELHSIIHSLDYLKHFKGMERAKEILDDMFTDEQWVEAGKDPEVWKKMCGDYKEAFLNKEIDLPE